MAVSVIECTEFRHRAYRSWSDRAGLPFAKVSLPLALPSCLIPPRTHAMEAKVLDVSTVNTPVKIPIRLELNPSISRWGSGSKRWSRCGLKGRQEEVVEWRSA
jgi:hypothetical protein